MKKFFLLAALLIATTISAQEIISDKTDAFNGSRQIITSWHEIASDGPYTLEAGISRTISKSGSNFYLMTLSTNADIGCCGCASCEVKILTDSGEILLLNDYSSVDCSDACLSIIDITKEIDISVIRVVRSSGYRDFTLTQEGKEMLNALWITVQKP